MSSSLRYLEDSKNQSCDHIKKYGHFLLLFSANSKTYSELFNISAISGDRANLEKWLLLQMVDIRVMLVDDSVCRNRFHEIFFVDV